MQQNLEYIEIQRN